MAELPRCDDPGDPQMRRGWLPAILTLDCRSLAAMRIGLGLVLLLNVCDLAWEIPAFYTDAGLLPREARMQLNPIEQFTAPPYWCSLHMLSGEAWFQGLLFALSGVLALGVMVGYRTNWALFGSWLLLVSLQARNPLVLQGGDDVLRCLLFWSLFLPLGARWSVDGRRESHGAPKQVCSLASAALLIQLGCIYVFTGLLKSHAEWRIDFTAIHYALSTDHFTTQLGQVLLRFPTLLQGLTLGTLVLEIGGPLVLLYPARSWRVRTALVASFCLLHLGIGATMRLGLFPATCLVYWLAVLPGGFWELPLWKRLATRLVGWPFQAVADITVWNGRPASQSVSTNVLIVVLLCYVVLLNVARLTPSIYAHVAPGPVRSLGDAAQLDQFWVLFAPRPHDHGGWFNLRGTLADGTRVNLLHPSLPPQETRPELVSANYPSLRWRKLLLTLYERDCPTYRRGVGEFLRRRWNEGHGPDQQLVAVDVILVLVRTPPPGQTTSAPVPAEPMVLWHWESPDLAGL